MIAGEKACSWAPFGDQPPQRRRIDLIVLRDHPVVGVGRRVAQNGLVVLRQRVPLVDVDESAEHRAAFPPTGRVVVLGDLVEAKLLVVIRADPLGGVDHALFQRRIDVGCAEQLRTRRRALAMTRPGKPPMRNLRPLRSSTVLISLRNQPPIWQPVLPAEQHHDVVFFVELVEHVAAAALDEPTLVEALVRAEGDRRAEGEGRILAEIIVGRRMRYLDGRRSMRRRAPATPERFRQRRRSGSGICCRWLQRRLSTAFRRRRTACRAISASWPSSATSLPASIGRWPAWRPR